MAHLPVIGRWVRVRRWLQRYLGDVGYRLLVQGGASLFVIVAGLVIGDQGFDLFGRKTKQAEVPKPWFVEVTKEAR